MRRFETPSAASSRRAARRRGSGASWPWSTSSCAASRPAPVAPRCSPTSSRWTPDTGRVWSSATRELRQAPAVGEERVLAERNRREELVRASEAAARVELAAKTALDQATGACQSIELARDQAIGAHRAALADRDEAAEAERRIAAAIERRRSAPDDGPNEGRRIQLQAELRAERERADRNAREREQRPGAIALLQDALPV